MLLKDPFRELYQLQRAMNRLFDGYAVQKEQFPAVNIWGNNENAVITAEIPGFEAEDINVGVVQNQLIIEAARKEEEVDKEAVYHRKERGYGQFSKAVDLPFEVEADKVKASYRNGVLTVTLPRKAESKPKKIEITT